jgi:hypothetical protein
VTKDFSGASDTLTRCNAFVKDKAAMADKPALLFKIASGFAHLYNGQDNVDQSLKYLEHAIDYANQQDQLSGHDPLVLMPAETFLNTANALNYL